MKTILLGLAISLLSSTAWSHDDYAKAKLYDLNGLLIGKVKFYQSGNGVLVKVHVKGQAPGFHGFHIHANGECIDNFTSAGPHFEQDIDTDHQNHNGDMPVLLVNNNGKGTAAFKTDRFKVKDLFDQNDNGRAVILHALPDNYANIPERYVAAAVPGPDTTTLATGDAGSRIVCGVIKH